MYKVKLIKGLSCRVGKIRATKESPFCKVSNKEDLDQVLSSGYFELVSTPEEKQDLKLTSRMNLEQLKSFAKEHEINIEGLTKVAEIRSAISIVLDNKTKSEINGSENEEFEVDFNQ